MQDMQKIGIEQLACLRGAGDKNNGPRHLFLKGCSLLCQQKPLLRAAAG